MVYIGIDIGRNGGICVLNEHAQVLSLDVMPRAESEFVDSVQDIVEHHVVAGAWLEVPFASKPSRGFVKFCEHAGYVRGVLEAHHINVERVQASIWMREMHLTNVGDTKVRSAESARYYYPDQNFKRSTHHAAKEFHDGLVDALLIARYGLEISTRACT